MCHFGKGVIIMTPIEIIQYYKISSFFVCERERERERESYLEVIIRNRQWTVKNPSYFIAKISTFRNLIHNMRTKTLRNV